VSGRVALAELREYGLARQPACVGGVGMPTVPAVLCRGHLNREVLDDLGIVDGLGPTGAVLLVGSPSTERALGVWCAVCRMTAETG